MQQLSSSFVLLHVINWASRKVEEIKQKEHKEQINAEFKKRPPQTKEAILNKKSLKMKEIEISMCIKVCMMKLMRNKKNP